ncbi:intradiol ring-cleavage dioxygenase [Asticcacaulis sp. BYS171W]|uniref:Intradiol ring-cleavage dioxygenase n=1 Tax=Asticcacaulis aquaticus TaxID=2984212 RepID=A0ABT5HPP1_9CAUL|nr:intradiol ring-cleavage dioxygenase [Asticcacaulis aquaticus]MDC7681954.1 intradiol ring-cleavage dioxygenase [Asticcacaulis aquaticus]
MRKPFPSRRHVMSLIGGVALASRTPALAETCVALPEETEGPFPADGSRRGPPGPNPGMQASNAESPNALKLPFIERRDIRTSGNTGAMAAGVPLTLRIRLTGAGCRPLADHAVYIWNCTRDGQYSLYALPKEDFLRGIQPTDKDGVAEFLTIIPGCYDGRMPHIHVEVYPSPDKARSADDKIATTQFAFDRALCEQIYREVEGYEASTDNLARVSFDTDMVFGDNTAAEREAQTVKLTGNVREGFVGTVTLALGDGPRQASRMGPPPGGFGGSRPPFPPRG